MAKHVRKLSADVVVIGGGITGLSCYHACRHKGYQTLLLETNKLGYGQTIASQGIIHGGIKYALHGKISKSMKAIQAAPIFWENSLKGHTWFPIKNASQLSTYQYLCSSQKLLGRLTTFFASKILKSYVEHISIKDDPLFEQLQIHGQVYKINEIVIDVPKLIKELFYKGSNNIIHAQNVYCYNHQINADIDQKQYKISSQAIICCAGGGNQSFLKNKNLSQQRPLHMVWLKAKHLPKFYGHIIEGLNKLPVLTISTHHNQHVWYLGGQLAEQGIFFSKAEQIQKAQELLSRLFPSLDLTYGEFGSYYVERIEYNSHGEKPESYRIHQDNYQRYYIWPTKLALAPLAANELIDRLQLKPQDNQLNCSNLPKPSIATPPWESDNSC